jgi:peptide/nickel transport system permease protein
VLSSCIVVLMVVSGTFQLTVNEFANQASLNHCNLPCDHLFAPTIRRDLYSRVVHGTRTSFLSGLAVVALTCVAGTIVGMIAAGQGELIDDLLMRTSDIFLAFPPLVIAIVFIGFLGPGLQNALLALVLIRWPQYARLSRGITLSTLHSSYIEASRAMGASSPMLFYRHVLPNSFSPILIKGSLDLGETILITGALSFLGLGVQPPTPELGALVTQGRDYI